MMKTTIEVSLVLLLFQGTLLFKRGQCLRNPQIELSSGTVEGFHRKSVNGKDFISFEGIPYAQPPVGNNRFKEPQPVETWPGILKANTLYKCLQYRQFTPPGEEPIAGEEDCLYINVYTPSIQGNFDVIVFIHGGAFMFFEPGLFGPKIIMNRNVVYVNFSYRLGPFGFLSTEDEVVPGNFGFRDQIAALKWVKENIHHFGGNSSSITVTGFSAGSASVHLHYLSPLSKNLFHRGISQSGSALNAWVLQENAKEKAARLAELLGCPSETSAQIVSCLSERSGRQIVDAVKEFQSFRYLPFSPFGVVVDKWSKNPVLPEYPYVLLQKGNVQDLPWMVSHADKEGLYPTAEFLSADGLLETLNKNWNEILPMLLDYNYTVHPQNKDSVSQKIRKEYLQDLPLSRQTFDKLVQMTSDRIFVNDMQKAVRLQASVTKSPVYYYYYTYRSAHSISELLRQSNEDLGCCHGDDTILILSGAFDTQSREKDREMSRILVDIWISFARDSIPTLPINEPWPKVPKDPSRPLAYVKIASPSDIEPLEESKFGNPDFWNSLPLMENENHFLQSHTKTEL